MSSTLVAENFMVGYVRSLAYTYDKFDCILTAWTSAHRPICHHHHHHHNHCHHRDTVTYHLFIPQILLYV